MRLQLLMFWPNLNDPGLHLVIGGILSLINAILLTFCSYKSVEVLQQRHYSCNNYLKWVFKNNGKYFMRLFNVCLFSAGGYVVFNILFHLFADNFVVSLIGLIFYIMITLCFIVTTIKGQVRQKLQITSRVIRLWVTIFILSIVSTAVVILLAYFLTNPAIDGLLFYIRYILVCFTPLLTPLLVFLAKFINAPIENSIKHKYIRQTQEILKKRPDLKIIGITGSFGKTSVKMILTTILQEKYHVLATKKSFNTPMGITKTVLEELKLVHNIFVVEMGARHVGDIKEICNFISCDYGIITSVGNQHLECFGNVENILNTKFELIEKMKQDGIAFFNVDDDGAKKLYERCKIEKVKSGIKENDILTCKDIKISKQGCSFDISDGKNTLKCKTLLFGEHNVNNIMIAATLAYKIGLSLEEIQRGISKIEPISHRLELINADNNITIIDDSYNANVKGTVAALNVIGNMEGRKVIVTPGMVELGDKEEEENYNFGLNIAKTCDFAILIGNKRVKPIVKALLKCGFEESAIRLSNSLEEAKKIMQDVLMPGDVVLLENDLPDIYIE